MLLQYLSQMALVVVVVVGLAGCGGTQSPACNIPEQGNLLIYATDRVNPDENGQALPTIVRVYQLTNLGSLELASFEDIWENAEETLGDTMLVEDEVTIYPGQRVTRAFERDPAANYIVGVAIVRRPSGASWRSVLDLPISAEAQRCAALQEDPEEAPEAPALSRVVFRLDGYSIEGNLRLDESSGGCGGDLDCIRGRAESSEPPDMTEEAPEAPEQPQTPEIGEPSMQTPVGGKHGS